MGFFLDRRAFIPDQSIAPRPRRRIGTAIDHGAVDPFRLAASELLLQLALSLRMLREDDQSGRVPIDTVYDERPPLARPPQMILDLFEDRCRRLANIERHRQQSRRLVEDD